MTPTGEARPPIPDAAGNGLRAVLLAGRNPFSMCLMAHVGHRWPIAYEPVIGDVTGGMYQGIGSRNGDDPFLSPNCHYTQKEIWGGVAGMYLLAVSEAAPGARLPASAPGPR